MASNSLGKSLVFIVGFLICGAANSVLSKMMLRQVAPDFYGVEKAFEKPWFKFFINIFVCE